MFREVSRFRVRALCTLLAALPTLAYATTQIQRGPIDTPNSVGTRTGSGYMDWNLVEGIPFVSEGGVTLTTKVAADDSTGVIRVYAASDTRGVSGIPDVHIAYAAGQVSGSAILLGVGTDPVPVSFQFAFDGSFLTHSGNSFHQLGVSLTVGTPSATVPFGVDLHQVNMDFRTDSLDDQAILVNGESQKSYFDAGAGTYVAIPYAGGSYTVLKETMEEVAGVVRLDMMLHAGQRLEIVARLFAQSFSEPFPYTGEGDYSQSAGAVDALNTGTLGIVLPDGYTLTGDAGLLTNAVMPATLPVPEPHAYALLVAGLGTVLAMTRRRRSLRH